MIRRPITPLVLLSSVAALALAAAPAEAGKVVVLAVSGDPEGELEDGLISIVEDRHDLVTSGEFERVARRAGVDDLDGRAIGKVAKKLGADAVIESSVSKEDEGFLLTVRIRGANGKTVKKISVDLPRPRLSKKAKKRLGTGVLDGIDTVLGIDAEPELDEDAEEDRERSRRKAKRAARELAKDDELPRKKDKKRKKAKRTVRDEIDDDAEIEIDDEDEDEEVARDEDDEEVDEGDDETRVAARDDDDDLEEALGVRDDADDEGDAPRTSRPWTRPAIRLDVGGSGKLRQLSFTSRPYDQAPLGYKSAMVPGARIAGEAYPVALVSDGAAAGLGVGFEYDKTMLLTTRSSDAPDIALETTQAHWSVGARYRHAFGDSPTAPSITIGAGYGRRVFAVAREMLPADARLDMPDVDYRFYDPGLAVRLPIGGKLALHAAGKALLFKQAGPIQNTTSYGGAKLTGVDVAAGFDIRVAKAVVLGVAGSFTQIGYVFVGNGEETNNRDLDPTTIDVGGASDRYFGVAATLGVVY